MPQRKSMDSKNNKIYPEEIDIIVNFYHFTTYSLFHIIYEQIEQDWEKVGGGGRCLGFFLILLSYILTSYLSIRGYDILNHNSLISLNHDSFISLNLSYESLSLYHMQQCLKQSTSLNVNAIYKTGRNMREAHEISRCKNIPGEKASLCTQQLVTGKLYRTREELPDLLHPLDSQNQKQYSNHSNGCCPLTSFLSNDQAGQRLRGTSRKQKMTASEERMGKKLLLRCPSQEVTTASSRYCRMVFIEILQIIKKTRNKLQTTPILYRSIGEHEAIQVLEEIMSCYCSYRSKKMFKL